MSWIFGVNKEQAVPENFEQLASLGGGAGSGKNRKWCHIFWKISNTGNVLTNLINVETILS